MDEPCHGAYEGPRAGRWITAVYVIRGDAIAEYVIDHGEDIVFEKIPPMMIPSFGENRVGDLLELCERHRHDLRWWKRALEWKGESTLIRDVINQEEERRLFIRNRSTLGPYLTKQRGVYSSAEAYRRFSKRRAERTKKRMV